MIASNSMVVTLALGRSFPAKSNGTPHVSVLQMPTLRATTACGVPTVISGKEKRLSRTNVEAAICEALHVNCNCSPCEDSWLTFYDCLTADDCGGLSCEPPGCGSLLIDAIECLVLLPDRDPCVDCVNSFVEAIPSGLPCDQFKANICKMTSEVCSCSPCEEEIEQYFLGCGKEQCTTPMW